MKAMTLRIPQVFSRFARDRRGVAAIEFAVVAPIMIGLYLGCAELPSAIGAQRKVILISSTIANLASQPTTISTSGMTNMLNASTAIIAPYSATTLGVTVSCLNIDSKNNVTVAWSATQNGNVRSAGSAVTIPSALVVPNSQVLFSEVNYAYTSTLAYTFNLSHQMYMRPRISAPTLGTTACT